MRPPRNTTMPARVQRSVLVALAVTLPLFACTPAVAPIPPRLASGIVEYTTGQEWRVRSKFGTRIFAEAIAVPCEGVWFPSLDQPARDCLVFDPGIHGLGGGPLRVAVVNGPRVLMMFAPAKGNPQRQIEANPALAADIAAIRQWVTR